MLQMTRQEYSREPKDYRSYIDGKPYLMTLDNNTGGTVLVPVVFKKNPTMATIKSFIKKNDGKLFIKNLSNFDGMVDCVMPCDDKSFRAVTKPDKGYNHENKLGIQGAWFVLHGGDRIYEYSDGYYEGYEVYNCCGHFILVIEVSA